MTRRARPGDVARGRAHGTSGVVGEDRRQAAKDRSGSGAAADVPDGGCQPGRADSRPQPAAPALARSGYHPANLIALTSATTIAATPTRGGMPGTVSRASSAATMTAKARAQTAVIT